jgi:hypothetical protein
MFEYLGFKFVTGMAFYLASVRQSYPMNELGRIQELTDEEWKLIESIIVTWQYSISSKPMIDITMTRFFGLLFKNIEYKLTQEINGETKEEDMRY